jgi:hypothetical protein
MRFFFCKSYHLKIINKIGVQIGSSAADYIELKKTGCSQSNFLKKCRQLMQGDRRPDSRGPGKLAAVITSIGTGDGGMMNKGRKVTLKNSDHKETAVRGTPAE